MKKLKLFGIGALLVLLATGCGMRAEYNISISKNKDVNVEIVSAMDNEMIDAMLGMGSSDDSESKTYTDEERWEYVESNSEEDESYKDFDKVKYDKDGYKGYTYSLKLGKIDDLVAKDSETVEFDKLGKDAKLFTKKGNVYTLKIKQSDEESEQMKQYANSVAFDLKLKVKLPNKAKSNNATEVDGTTYIWDLTKTQNIDLSFTLDSKATNNTVLIIGGVCACTAIVICGVVLVLNKNKKKKAEM